MVKLLKQISPHDFAPGKEDILPQLLSSARLGSVAPTLLRDICLRIWFVVAFLAPPIILLECAHIALAIFFMYVIRIDTADDWPDLFGSLAEAYTLRCFWTMYVSSKFRLTLADNATDSGTRSI